MRRLVAVATLLALTALVVVLAGAGGDGGENRPDFTIEFDNAFGVALGGDVKIAGVRAGKVSSLEVNQRTLRAEVGFDLYREGFGDLRSDAFCEVRPQSLLGEYFIDCLPGTGAQRLPRGGRIPVERTGGTVPADLVGNVLRRPYRERFSLILAEFGTAVTARGADLNATIRRASPALRATNKTLAALAQERRALRDLVADARVVVEGLSDRRQDVTRFIRDSGRAAAVSGPRQAEIAAQWRALPGFLQELRATMPLLGEAAERQAPALRGLRTQAGALDELLARTGPFLERTEPFVEALATTSREGTRAAAPAASRFRELQRFSAGLPEMATNLGMVGEHIDDRRNATEPDQRSPGGQGFTGLESLLRFFYAQQQASNVYDGNSYMVKSGASVDPACLSWADAAAARNDARKRCRGQLGARRPGIDDETGAVAERRAAAQRRRSGRATGPTGGPDDARPEAGGARPGARPEIQRLPRIPELPGLLPQIPPTPEIPPIRLPPIGDLLDLLLG